jgi:hypothetical protein
MKDGMVSLKGAITSLSRLQQTEIKFMEKSKKSGLSECLLSFGAVSFTFQFDIQRYKD